MRLLIDAGNTRVKWAAAVAGSAPGDWVAQGAFVHADLGQAVPRWRSLPISGALVCNVAGPAVAAQIGAALASAGVGEPAVEWFRSTAARAGVTNAYRQPAQLGSDRFAALIGARHRYPGQALLVATCGTATTIDLLDATGRFCGGMILPGLATMARSLALHTAQLPAVSESALGGTFADHTEAAIASGCIHAQVGAIVQARQAAPGARCLLSGGAASYIADHLPPPFERVDQLVLLGLHAVAGAGAA